jgi:hypothetical protein
MNQQKRCEALMQKVDKCMCSDLADYIMESPQFLLTQKDGEGLANRHKYSTVYHQMFPTDETPWSLVSFEVCAAIIGQRSVDWDNNDNTQT